MFDRLREKWEVLQRYILLNSVVSTCEKNPNKISDICEKNNLSEDTVKQLINWTEVGSLHSHPINNVRIIPIEDKLAIKIEQLNERKDREHSNFLLMTPRQIEEMAEKALKAICMLIDTPVAKNDPELMSRIIIKISQSLAQRESVCIQAFDEQLSATTEVMQKLDVITARLKSLLSDYIKMHALLSASINDEHLLYEIPIKRLHLLESIVRQCEDDLNTSSWKSLQLILDNSFGSPNILSHPLTPLKCFDMMNSDSDRNISPQSMIDILVVVSAKIHEIELEIEEYERLSYEILKRFIDSKAASNIPFRHINWSFDAGLQREVGYSQGGKPIAGEVDVVWDYAASLLKLSNTDTKETGSSLKNSLTKSITDIIRMAMLRDDERSEFINNYDREFQSDVASENSQSPLFNQEVTRRTLIDKIRNIVDNDFAEVDPEFTVHILHSLCQYNGNLSWKICLELANSRARYHEYVDAFEIGVNGFAKWEVRAGVRKDEKGDLEVPYSLVQQPLSLSFRNEFENRDLEGRLAVLWNMVKYAGDLHNSISTIGQQDLNNQINLREIDLLNMVKNSK